MTSPFVGEFLGTMILVLLGNGVVAGVLLEAFESGRQRMDGHHGWMGVCGDGRRLRVDCVRKQRCPFESGSHDGLRGARRKLSGSSLPTCCAAARCHCGSYSRLAALFAALERNAGCGQQSWHVFAQLLRFAALRRIYSAKLLRTFVLVFVVGAIFSKSVSATGPAAGLGPYLVGSLVWGIGLSLGGTTGYAINPARDLGPRIAHAVLPIAGKGGSDWGYSPIPVIGPLIGGALAGLLLRVLAVF